MRPAALRCPSVDRDPPCRARLNATGGSNGTPGHLSRRRRGEREFRRHLTRVADAVTGSVTAPMDHAAESVVELRAAVVVLGSFPALAGVDIRVEESEIVLLRG